MIIADSSVWIEVFLEGVHSTKYVEQLSKEGEILVPAIVLFEVYKKILMEADETSATEAALTMQKSKIIDLDKNIAILAAKLSAGEKLPMADATIYAIALLYGATVWTQDADFEGLPNVKYFPKKL